MKILNIYLENFRNFSKININFGSHTNILVGKNAQGKTNILESIYFLAYSKSYRTSFMENLIKRGSQNACVSGMINSDNYTQELLILIDNNGKQLYKEKKLVDLANYLGNLQIVLYDPFTLILSGLPRERRRYIDRAIVSLNSKYLVDLANYNRVIKQRNLLLKRGYSNKEGEVWDEQFIKHAIVIWEMRFEHLNKLCKEIEKLKTIFFKSNDELQIGLKTYPLLSMSRDVWYEEIKSNIKLINQKEREAGFTLVGPHRDDIIIMLNGMDMRSYGSSGQLKAILILLTLAQINMFYSIYNEYPVLICDDVDTELDEEKLDSFLSSLGVEMQIFLTTTKKELSNRIPTAEVYEVQNGEVSRLEAS